MRGDLGVFANSLERPVCARSCSPDAVIGTDAGILAAERQRTAARCRDIDTAGHTARPAVADTYERHSHGQRVIGREPPVAVEPEIWRDPAPTQGRRERPSAQRDAAGGEIARVVQSIDRVGVSG